MQYTTSERCEKCHGHGDIPSGYDRFGSGLMAWRVCPVCDGRGSVPTDPEPTPPAGTLRVGGHTVTAPTFRDAGQFDRAIGRAFADGLQIAPTDRPDAVLVVNPTTGASYTTTRQTCSCTAGRRGVPCKHVAYAVMVADVWHALPTPATVPARVAA